MRFPGGPYKPQLNWVHFYTFTNIPLCHAHPASWNRLATPVCSHREQYHCFTRVASPVVTPLSSDSLRWPSGEASVYDMPPVRHGPHAAREIAKHAAAELGWIASRPPVGRSLIEVCHRRDATHRRARLCACVCVSWSLTEIYRLVRIK